MEKQQERDKKFEAWWLEDINEDHDDLNIHELAAVVRIAKRAYEAGSAAPPVGMAGLWELVAKWRKRVPSSTAANEAVYNACADELESTLASTAGGAQAAVMIDADYSHKWFTCPKCATKIDLQQPTPAVEVELRKRIEELKKHAFVRDMLSAQASYTLACDDVLKIIDEAALSKPQDAGAQKDSVKYHIVWKDGIHRGEPFAPMAPTFRTEQDALQVMTGLQVDIPSVRDSLEVVPVPPEAPDAAK